MTSYEEAIEEKSKKLDRAPNIHTGNTSSQGIWLHGSAISDNRCAGSPGSNLSAVLLGNANSALVADTRGPEAVHVQGTRYT